MNCLNNTISDKLMEEVKTKDISTWEEFYEVFGDRIYNKFMDRVGDKQVLTWEEFEYIFDSEISKYTHGRIDAFVNICWSHAWDFRHEIVDGKRQSFVFRPGAKC